MVSSRFSNGISQPCITPEIFDSSSRISDGRFTIFFIQFILYFSKISFTLAQIYRYRYGIVTILAGYNNRIVGLRGESGIQFRRRKLDLWKKKKISTVVQKLDIFSLQPVKYCRDVRAYRCVFFEITHYFLKISLQIHLRGCCICFTCTSLRKKCGPRIQEIRGLN